MATLELNNARNNAAYIKPHQNRVDPRLTVGDKGGPAPPNNVLGGTELTSRERFITSGVEVEDAPTPVEFLI